MITQDSMKSEEPNKNGNANLYEEETLQPSKYLLFKLSEEDFGMDVNDVVKIIELQGITRMNNLPEYVEGFIELKGSMIPVFDLKPRFDMEKKVYDEMACIILAKIKNHPFGILADTALDIIEIPDNKIELQVGFESSEEAANYFTGVGKTTDNIKLILDFDKIIHPDDFLKVLENMNEYGNSKNVKVS